MNSLSGNKPSAGSSNSSAIVRACATCARGVRSFSGRYREFLLDPGTLVTALSALLLVIAIASDPQGVISSGEGDTPLYIASALIGSLFIWWSAIQGIRERDFTADIPVSLATAAAIAVGEYSAAAVVAVLLLVGGLLEEFVAARAGRALEALESLLPDKVWVRREESDLEIDLEEVQVGDLVLVRPGERIPVDGLVISGKASVDQATITGESVPVEKSEGDSVFAGTLSSLGALEIQTTGVGDSTTLGQIRRMVAEAEDKKAPVERVLDQWAKLYTPVAILLAGILWAVTGDIVPAITMLIVFCPCVMVLATPTALVASIGNAALRGSLIKQGASVEALARVDTVVFDKTGTITLGKPQITAITSVGDKTDDEILSLAASAEKFSEHPVADAILSEAHKRGITVKDPDSFEALPGMGVQAVVDGRRISVGRPTSLGKTNPIPEQLRSTENGNSTVLVLVDETPAAILSLQDETRDEASRTVAELHKLGLGTALLSGDRTDIAEGVARSVGIADVKAEVMPNEKAAEVVKLQKEGKVVAFVGDGVNDGPALAVADVGVAMGLTGTDLAIETGQVALLSDDLSKLPHLVGLSQKAMKAIYQNLAFSLGVLGIAVVLTFLQILNPVTGALLHELSSIPVIANSARLIGLREKK